MDVNLDGPIDGIEAARQIQAVRNIRVVYVTAYAASLENAKRKEILGGCLLKPFRTNCNRQLLAAWVTVNMASKKLHECSLLYVEDDDATAYLFQSALQHTSLSPQLFRATNGEDAMRSCCRPARIAMRPSLILCCWI